MVSEDPPAAVYRVTRSVSNVQATGIAIPLNSGPFVVWLVLPFKDA